MKTDISFLGESRGTRLDGRAVSRAWLVALTAGTLAFSAGRSPAETYYWTGANAATQTGWNSGANWVNSSGNALTGSTITLFTVDDTVVFSATNAQTAKASVLGDLRVGTWRFSNVSSGFDITGAAANNNQVGIISSALIVDEDSGAITIRGRFGLDGNVTFTNNSGSDLTPNPVIFTQDILGGAQGFSFLNNAATVSGAAGSLTLAKGAFQFEGVAKSYDGAIYVRNGATFIANSANFTGTNLQITVESGARLIGGGTGKLGGSGGTAATVIKNGGSLLVGDPVNNIVSTLSFGKDLTLESGALSLLKLDNVASYDQVQVGGLLTYGGELRLTITSDLLESLTGGETFNLFAGGFAAGGALDSITFYEPGASSIIGIGEIGELSSVSSGLWSGEVEGVNFNFDEVTGILNVIPEPNLASLLFVGGVFVGLFGFRKRISPR